MNSFKFSKENKEAIKRAIAKYPEGKQRSAVMDLLHLAQKQNDNWIPEPAMIEIAKILDMPRIKVFEVATFYTMYNLNPVGKNHIDICTNISCCLNGSDEIVKTCENHLGIRVGEATPDNEFSLNKVECLGACVNAPVMQVNGEKVYEELNVKKTLDILDKLSRDVKNAE